MFITPSPVFDASVSGGADGNLPEWDLNDLYQGTDDPKLTKIWHGWKVNARHLPAIMKASWRS